MHLRMLKSKIITAIVVALALGAFVIAAAPTVTAHLSKTTKHVSCFPAAPQVGQNGSYVALFEFDAVDPSLNGDVIDEVLPAGSGEVGQHLQLRLGTATCFAIASRPTLPVPPVKTEVNSDAGPEPKADAGPEKKKK